MLPYQCHTVDNFVKMLPRSTRDILEIGSDIGGEVVTAIAKRTGANVVGINPSDAFPSPLEVIPPNATLFRADGRKLPFPDASFDAVLSVATMEHVQGLDLFISEVARVLRPKGLFHTDFCPIWSSALGHHVFAVVGDKEARFWKPGKNPVPDYSHLLWSPDEMREYLRSGPTSEELIEPIVQWIYFDDSINRCHFEEYMEAFSRSMLSVQSLYYGYDRPDEETLAKLKIKYGVQREFKCNSIYAVLRKLPNCGMEILPFKGYLFARRNLGPIVLKVLGAGRMIARLLRA